MRVPCTLRSGAAVVLFGLVAVGVTSADPHLIPPRVTAPEIFRKEGTVVPLDAPVILFWNMHWFPGGPRGDLPLRDQEDKIRGSARLLRSVDADLVILCEVFDLASLRHMELDYPYIACTKIPRPAGDNTRLADQNMALLSRYPPTRTWVVDFSGLPDTPDRPSRGILAAQFPRSGGGTLTCYVLHLKSNLGGYRPTALRRERAIDYLLADMQRLQLDPDRDAILIAGDMNTVPHHPLYRREQTLPRLEARGFVHLGKRPSPGSSTADAYDHFYLSSALERALGEKNRTEAVAHPCPESLSDHSLLELRLE